MEFISKERKLLTESGNAIGLRIDKLWDELNDLRESDDPDTFKLYHMLGQIHGLQEAEEGFKSLITELDKVDKAFSALKDQHAKADAELIDLKHAALAGIHELGSDE